MRFSPSLEQGRLLRRYKRFLADIELANGEQLTIHCPNTGSMLNCMREGGQVWFSRSNDPKRKLPGTWEISETPQGRLACVNTGRANALVEEALRADVITELAGFTALKREVAYGEEGSRIDFRLEFDGAPVYVEVKSVTLGYPDSTVAAFPDAVTQRGAKHLRELATLARQGVRAVQLYCVNLTGIDAVRRAVDFRRVQTDFHARGEAAWQDYLRSGVSHPVDEVFDRVQARIDARRRELQSPST